MRKGIEGDGRGSTLLLKEDEKERAVNRRSLRRDKTCPIWTFKSL